MLNYKALTQRFLDCSTIGFILQIANINVYKYVYIFIIKYRMLVNDIDIDH